MLIIGFPLCSGILLSETMNASYSITGDEKLNAAGAFLIYLFLLFYLFV